MARKKTAGGGDHKRRLPPLRVTVTKEVREIIREAAAELCQPGMEPNMSEGVRRIALEWKAGTRAKADLGEPIRRGRKKNPD